MTPSAFFRRKRIKPLLPPLLILCLLVASLSVLCVPVETGASAHPGLRSASVSSPADGTGTPSDSSSDGSFRSATGSPIDKPSDSDPEGSFRSARGSPDWHDAADSAASSPRSPRGSERFDRPWHLPSSSPTSEHHGSSSDEEAQWSAIAQDRLRVERRERNIIEDAGGPALSTREVGETSTSSVNAATPENNPRAAGDDRAARDIPAALVAKNLPNGGEDVYLTSPENQRIKDAIKALPQSRNYYQLITTPDPAAPGGSRVYRYYNEPYGTRYERLPYMPPFLSRIRRLEAQDHQRKPPSYEEEQILHAPQKGTQVGRKLSDAQWKLRTHLDDLKDVIAVGRDRRLANYHTTGGVAALYGREEIGMGKTIPSEARRIAQELGQVHVFYDPDRPQNQVRVAYHGPLLPPGRQTPLAPADHFSAYIVPKDRALPLPKHWRDEGLDERTRSLRALRRMREAENGEWRTVDIRDRWPAKWDQKTNEWRNKVNGWRQSMQNAPTKVKEWYRGRGQNADVGTDRAGQEAQQQADGPWRQRLGDAWIKAKGRWTQPRREPDVDASRAAAAVADSSQPSPVTRAWTDTLNNAVQKVKQASTTAKAKVTGWIKTPSTASEPRVITANAQDVIHPVRRRR
ncbi:Peptidyl-prolyl cis-trans isomerase A [Pseudozyma hubeiensis]|nr:Peptidyl-prolyl cis-trans isomerase A [Pseudozyma hubeiensis]